MLLTKGRDDGTSDAVGHTDCKDAHGPGVLQTKLELVSLALHTSTQRVHHTEKSNETPVKKKLFEKYINKAPLTRLT